VTHKKIINFHAAISGLNKGLAVHKALIMATLNTSCLHNMGKHNGTFDAVVEVYH